MQLSAGYPKKVLQKPTVGCQPSLYEWIHLICDVKFQQTEWDEKYKIDSNSGDPFSRNTFYTQG